MRHHRRGGHGGPEFGGSGEDSFVAVVVTKLTGALLFILLLTMVIMALIPRASDLAHREQDDADADAPLAITTPERLPEAIAGRPYAVALAATGGSGTRHWSVAPALPEGLSFDPETGVISGTPKAGTAEPVRLVVNVSDAADRASRAANLTVFESSEPLSTPSRWAPGLPPVPIRAWLEQGFGFVMLVLVHLVGMQTLGNLEQRATMPESSIRRRFAWYRAVVRLATMLALAGLAFWLWRQRGA